MDVLTTAAGRAQETIGGALINAIINLSGAGDVQGVITKIDGIAAASEKAITRVGELGQALYFSLTKLNYAEFFGFSNAGIDRFEKIIEEQRRRAQYAGASPFDAGNNSVTGFKKDEKAAKDAKKAADLQAKLLKQSLDNQKKLTAEQKKQAALKKAGSVFDMEQIQLIAALKGKLSDDDRKRAEAQLAILNGNDVLATQLTKQILMAQDASGGLYRYFLSIGDAKIKNPFAFLDEWIMDFQKKLDALKVPALSSQNGTNVTGPNTSYNGFAYIPPGFGFDDNTIPETNATDMGSSGFVSTNSVTGTNVKVYVSGSVVTEQELIDAIQVGLQSNSLSGAPSQIGRIAGMFA
jgi:hypothetical protein